MKIPFDIKYRPQIESGEYKIVTNDDRPVRIISWDKKVYGGKYEIVALVPTSQGDTETVQLYRPDGILVASPYNEKFKLFVITPKPELTEFEQGIHDMIVNALTTTHTVSDGQVTSSVVMDYNTTQLLAAGLLELAKKEICKDCGFFSTNAYKELQSTDPIPSIVVPTYEPPCFHGGICTNPFKDCINCPRTGGYIGISTTSGSNKVE